MLTSFVATLQMLPCCQALVIPSVHDHALSKQLSTRFIDIMQDDRKAVRQAREAVHLSEHVAKEILKETARKCVIPACLATVD